MFADFLKLCRKLNMLKRAIGKSIFSDCGYAVGDLDFRQLTTICKCLAFYGFQFARKRNLFYTL